MRHLGAEITTLDAPSWTSMRSLDVEPRFHESFGTIDIIQALKFSGRMLVLSLLYFLRLGCCQCPESSRWWLLKPTANQLPSPSLSFRARRSRHHHTASALTKN